MAIPADPDGAAWMCEGCGLAYPSEAAALACETERDADDMALRHIHAHTHHTHRP